MAWCSAAFLFLQQVTASLAAAGGALGCPRTPALTVQRVCVAEARSWEPGDAASPAPHATQRWLVLLRCTGCSVLDACPDRDGKPLKVTVPASWGRFPGAVLALCSSSTATSWLRSTGLVGRMLNNASDHLPSQLLCSFKPIPALCTFLLMLYQAWLSPAFISTLSFY